MNFKNFKDGKNNKAPIAGTPGFAAPEQFLGSYQIDSSVDIYSFGRLLIFMIFEWESAFTLLYKPILHDQFDMNNNSLRNLRTILLKFLDPQPTKRIV